MRSVRVVWRANLVAGRKHLADTLLAVKVRRILLLLVALAVLIGSAPAAPGYGIAVGPTTRGASDLTKSDPAPKLSTLPLRHRASVAVPGTGRRFSHGTSRLFTLGAADARVRAEGAFALVDTDADARLLRASNTPCCGRGPPAAA